MAVRPCSRRGTLGPKLSTILVVDDDPGIRFLLRMTLEPEGHEVVEAADGESALLLAGPDPLPDVITMDLDMPRLGGAALIQRLRSEPRTASIPIVVVSANHNAAQALQVTGLVEAIVAKPFKPSLLTSCIQSVISGRLGAPGSDSKPAA
jgi:CheY-like chemotaxis protein